MSRTYDWTVTIGGVDVSELVKAAGTIDYGRSSRASGFTAPRAVFTMFTEAGYPQYAGTWPTIDKGAAVIIHVTHDGVTQWRRHTGVIQAVDWSRDEITVTSSGRSADYARVQSGETGAFVPITTETDSDRAERLADGADPALTIEGSAGRWVRLIPPLTPAMPLLESLVRLADDCQARFLEDRLGVPRYRTRNFTIPGRLTLPAGAVESGGLSMSTDRGDIINSVDVYYGEPNTSGGVQRHVHDEDAASIIVIGERRAEYQTDLQWNTGAAGKAAQLLLENADTWYMPDVPILMSQLTEGEADDILDLQEGWDVRVTPLPDGAPMTTYDGTVIGFTEIMHPTDYRMVLHLAPSVTPDTEVDESPIYPDGVLTGGDDTGIVADGLGREWRWITFGTPGDYWLTVDHTDAVLCQVAQAGGGGHGGGGGGLYGAGGGGGGGGLISAVLFINPGEWPVTIGAGGAAELEDGGDTVFYGARAYGGGHGGNGTEVDGGDGGSGGGAFFDRSAGPTTIGVPGVGIDGLGHDGFKQGGGAGGPDGSGVPITIAGATLTWSAGGPGAATSAPAPTDPGTGGQGGSIVGTVTPGVDGRLTLQYRIA